MLIRYKNKMVMTSKRREYQMQCSNIRKKLHAWMDNELPPQENDGIKTHLERCPACRAEAAAIRRVAASLEALTLRMSPWVD